MALINADIFLILGAPRSGTSMVAAMLQSHGIPMGIAFDCPTHDSPGGNLEDNLARLVNNRLMSTVDGSRCDWDRPSYVPGVAPTAVDLVRGYVRTRTKIHSSRWGVKDPRLCFTLEAWYTAMRESRVAWLHITRQCRSNVASSLARMLPAGIRKSTRPDVVERLTHSWAESYRVAAELGIARCGIEPIRLVYEDLLTQSGQEKVASQIGLTSARTVARPELDRESQRIQRDINQLVQNHDE